MIFMGTNVTTREALHIAQKLHPLDLVARAAFLRSSADHAATVSDQAAWLEALARTRGKR